MRLVDRLVESYNARDWNGFREMLSESVVMHVPGEKPCVGREANIEGIKAALSAFPDAQQKKIRSFGQDDWVCLQLVESGTNTGPLTTPDGKTSPPTEKTVSVGGIHVIRIRDGKITEYYECFDRLEILSQLGVG